MPELAFPIADIQTEPAPNAACCSVCHELAGPPLGGSHQQAPAAAPPAATDLRQLWHQALSLTSNGVAILDARQEGFPVVQVNPAFERMTGQRAAEVVGRPGIEVLACDAGATAAAELAAALQARRDCRTVLRKRRRDGRLYWSDLTLSPVNDGAGRVSYFLAIQNDVTELRRTQSELAYHAAHDGLTGLPNRSLMRERLERAIARASSAGEGAAVLFIDLDHFKTVNDSVGHDAGDALLCQAAARLRQAFRAADTVARPGGDEFVVVVERLGGVQEAVEAARRVLRAFDQPFHIGDQDYFVSASVGVARFPSDGSGAAELLRNADAALHRAKAQGRNDFRLYTAEMHAGAHRRLSLESALRLAVPRGELMLHYQPQVDLASGALIGFEALVRWRHPVLGLLGPGEFIGIAEESGLIVQVGGWVLREACRQLAEWRRHSGAADLFIAVNLSARQFGDGDLLRRVGAALTDAGLEARHLELELTESMLMQDPEAAVETLARLRDRGVRLSIDDFGTGYSSLGYLKRFPLHKLKIDRSFVRDITEDGDDAAIATAIIAMAHRLKLSVIAEGVETEGQVDYLREHGCDEGQGFLFGRPLPADACLPLLQSPAGQLQEAARAMPIAACHGAHGHHAATT